MKRAIEKAPKDMPFPMTLLNQVLQEIDSLTVSVVIGTTPTLTARVQCEDEAQARSVSRTIDQGLLTLSQQLSESQNRAGGQESPGQAERTKKLVDQLKTVKTAVNGNLVEALAQRHGDGGSREQLGAGHRRGPATGVRNTLDKQHQATGPRLDHVHRSPQAQWPDRLEDIKDFVGGEASLKQLLTNPITGDAAGYVYQKPEADLKNPAGVAVIFEATKGKKNESGLIGYADGHVDRAEIVCRINSGDNDLRTGAAEFNTLPRPLPLRAGVPVVIIGWHNRRGRWRIAELLSGSNRFSRNDTMRRGPSLFTLNRSLYGRQILSVGCTFRRGDGLVSRHCRGG